MTDDTTSKEIKQREEAPAAVKLQARSATIAAHSSNHATLRNAGFAWR